MQIEKLGITGSFLKGLCKDLHNPDCMYIVYTENDNLFCSTIKCGPNYMWEYKDKHIPIEAIEDTHALFKPIDELIELAVKVECYNVCKYVIQTTHRIIEFKTTNMRAGMQSTWNIFDKDEYESCALNIIKFAFSEDIML